MNTVAVNISKKNKRKKSIINALVKMLMLLVVAVASKGVLAAPCTFSTNNTPAPPSRIVTPPSRLTPGTAQGKIISNGWIPLSNITITGCSPSDFIGQTVKLGHIDINKAILISADGASYKAFKLDQGGYVGIIFKFYFQNVSYTSGSESTIGSTAQPLLNNGVVSYQSSYAFVTLKDIPATPGQITYNAGSYYSLKICSTATYCDNLPRDALVYEYEIGIAASTGNIAPITCSFSGSGSDRGTLDLPNVSLGTNFSTSAFSASNPGNWVGAGMKLDGACNASQIEMKFANGPGYTSPSGNANDFGAKVKGASDPSVGVELRRKDTALAIKPNDTATWNPPFATGTDFVEARLVKVGTGTPLVGNGTSAIQATMTYY